MTSAPRDPLPQPDAYRDWDASYVLGALSADERREFELHLAGCPDCSSAVASLAGLAGILGRLDGDDVAYDDVPGRPASLLPRLSAQVRRRRLRNAALAAAIAVGSAAAAAGITAVGLASGPGVIQPFIVQPSGTSLDFKPVAAGVPLTVTGSLQEERWGTQISWHCSYPAAVSYSASAGSTPGASTATGASAAPTDYVLVVTDKSGHETVAAGWASAPGSTANPTATVDLPLDQIRSVDIRWTKSGRMALRADL